MFVQAMAKVVFENKIFYLININKKINSSELVAELLKKNLKLYQVQEKDKSELAEILKQQHKNFLPVVFANDEYLQVFGDISASKETKETILWSAGVHYAVTQI